MPVDQWRHIYQDMEGNDLLCYEQPVSEFFGKIFLWRRFAGFASNQLAKLILPFQQQLLRL